MVQLRVNGRSAQVNVGATLLDAAKAVGVHIPTLCYHPCLPAHAVCRMCLVELDGVVRPQPACITQAKAGDVVVTDSQDLQDFRKRNTQWLLARHPNACRDCEVNGACRLQQLIGEDSWDIDWGYVPRGSIHHPEHSLIDHTSPSIWRDLSKCVECGLCAEACGASGQQQYVIGFAERGSERLPVTVFDLPLADTPCISCGQCTLVCPVGALIETPHWHTVLHTLDTRMRVSAVQVAPATRVAIGEEFGMEPGTVSTGQMIHALRLLGFDYVFDTNFAADVTVMEEATELLERLKGTEHLPLFTSCCPGWVNWVEIHRSDLLPHLSTTKSPQQMHGALTKRTGFTAALGPEFANGKAEPYVVSVMPCTAKKDEAQRPGISGDIDHVLTTRELARMIKARGIAFAALSGEDSFDRPLGESTGAAQIFAASGGVMEALLRTAAHLRGHDKTLALEWHQLRGVAQGIKVAEVPGIGKVAVCNGIAAAQGMLATQTWRDAYVAIEVMACVGGCLGGGGEPKSIDPLILEKRMSATYALDKVAPKRCAHENPDVLALYATQLDGPNSVKARALLHTHYAARHSKRLLLMRFLDCLDRRDSHAAVRVLHPDALWSTASPFGDIRGADGIVDFIHRQLPVRNLGPEFARHLMESPADEDDLIVLTPSGQRCRFCLDIETLHEGRASRVVIKALFREIL
ncbi:hypothetical protein DIC66_21575 [Rhodoferax lacus]|uniref:Uncharacterized protein n=2 Tax=Rhodoferax lacus TaxID=2184758 RepID=A0A3E1R607_9BURK|nr:hypothetical protein DIC66_21575 [Rhodoferax lacus]